MTNHLINVNYGIQAGPYRSKTDEKEVVVLDVVNNVWHRSKQLHTAIADPFVVYRPLSVITTHHQRMMMRLSEFKTLYHVI